MSQHEAAWVAVFKSASRTEAEIVRSRLQHEEIPAVIVNKQDSSYLTLLPGSVEVHVPETFAAAAGEIIAAS